MRKNKSKYYPDFYTKLNYHNKKIGDILKSFYIDHLGYL